MQCSNKACFTLNYLLYYVVHLNLKKHFLDFFFGFISKMILVLYSVIIDTPGYVSYDCKDINICDLEMFVFSFGFCSRLFLIKKFKFAFSLDSCHTIKTKYDFYTAQVPTKSLCYTWTFFSVSSKKFLKSIHRYS